MYVSAGAFIEMIRLGITTTAIMRYLSGTGPEERLKLIGSNGYIGIVSTAIISLVIWLCHFYFPAPIKNAGYELFFTWYPILIFLKFPFYNSLVVLQADLEFKKILFIKSFESGVFFLLLVINYIWLELSITEIVIIQLFISLSTSVICIIKGWDGLRYIGRATRQTTRILLDFGKFTTFTLIGSNLLKSADTLIISLSPLGTTAVALYSIPMKLTEIQQIPLRSFVATAFPKMSKASVHGKIEEVKNLFYTYSGSMTILFLFLCIITFVFADFFVLILGGSKFMGTHPTVGANPIAIMRAFSIYGFFLPIDRMTGVCLDSINKPGRNLIKVIIMVIANVVGDLVAVFIFKSLLLVAVGSILFAIIGVWVGFYLLDNELQLDYRKIVLNGIDFYKDLFLKIKHKQC